MGLRKDRRGMAVLVDALIFLVALTILMAAIQVNAPHGDADGPARMLGSYHAVMLSGELPVKDEGSMSAATLSEYLIALSFNGAPGEDQMLLIESMVNGTIAELEMMEGRSWLIIAFGDNQLLFGPGPPGDGDVHADRRDLGDGSVVSTLYVS